MQTLVEWKVNRMLTQTLLPRLPMMPMPTDTGDVLEVRGLDVHDEHHPDKAHVLHKHVVGTGVQRLVDRAQPLVLLDRLREDEHLRCIRGLIII